MRPAKSSWAVFIILSAGSVLMVMPFWVMVMASVMDQQALFQIPPRFWPENLLDLKWDNYARLFEMVPMGRYFLNSVGVSVVTTLGHVLFAAMAGYAFSRLQFPYKTAVFFMFLMTLMVPPQVNIVPLFFLMKMFHWVDSYWALIVPGLFGAFGVFLCRQWFQGLPGELEDAARLDGCNPWQVFWHVAMPLAKPVLTALAILVFIASWNSFMWPLIITNSESMQTLPVGIATLKGSFRETTDWPILMAASTVSVLPVIGLFLLAQRHFMAGILMGGMKE